VIDELIGELNPHKRGLRGDLYKRGKTRVSNTKWRDNRSAGAPPPNKLAYWVRSINMQKTTNIQSNILHIIQY
jgi:hypothetical protein